MRRHVALASALTAAMLASCASCSAAAVRTSSPTVTGAFAALSVHDLDRVAAWYSQHLGFQIQLRSQPANGPKGVVLVRPGARLELLEFSTAKSREAWGLPAEPHQVHGILKLGFEVSDIDALFASVQTQRLEIFFPLVTPPNSPLRTFGVLDPEGNIVQFFGK